MIEGSGRHISLYLPIWTQTKGMKSAGIEPAIAAIERAQIYEWQPGSAVVTFRITKFSFP